MNRVRLFTCLALALVVACFVAVWMTLPRGRKDVGASSVSYPAKLLRYGAETTEEKRTCVESRTVRRARIDSNGRVYPGKIECARSEVTSTADTVDPQTMKNHAIVFFGGLAAIVLLLGIAFGAASRKTPPPSRQSW